MNKFSKVLAMCMAMALIIGCMSVSAFAATPGDSLKNSIGSVEGDWTADNLEEDAFGTAVTGKDETQQQESEYHKVDITEDAQDIECDVYATQAAGEKVYDPENPDADPDGFVDGTVQVLLPKTIILGGEAEELPAAVEDASITGPVNLGCYVVAVKGNISGDSFVQVVPTTSFKMTTPGKDEIDSKIAQKVQKFYVADSTVTGLGEDAVQTVSTSFDDTHTLGYVYTTSPISAGAWTSVGASATPSFNISLKYFTI